MSAHVWLEKQILTFFHLSLSFSLSLHLTQTLFSLSFPVWTNTWPERPAGQTIDGKCPWLNQITSARFVAGDKERKRKYKTMLVPGSVAVWRSLLFFSHSLQKLKDTQLEVKFVWFSWAEWIVALELWKKCAAWLYIRSDEVVVRCTENNA